MYNRAKTVSLINGAGRNRQVYGKEWNIEESLTTHTKINSKWIKDSNARLDIIKLPEGNIGWTLL